MTWKNKRSGVVYKRVWWEQEHNHGTRYATVKVQSYKGGTGWVLSSNVVEVMEDAPEFDIITEDDVEVTIEDETPQADSFAVPSLYPNIHPILRDATYNVGIAITELVSYVSDGGAYHLTAAFATISDELRRLSDKEEIQNG